MAQEDKPNDNKKGNENNKNNNKPVANEKVLNEDERLAKEIQKQVYIHIINSSIKSILIHTDCLCFGSNSYNVRIGGRRISEEVERERR